MDARQAKELKAIQLLCEANGIDPTEMLADSKVDMVEAGKRVRMIQAVRQGMRFHIERRA